MCQVFPHVQRHRILCFAPLYSSKGVIPGLEIFSFSRKVSLFFVVNSEALTLLFLFCIFFAPLLNARCLRGQELIIAPGETEAFKRPLLSFHH